MATRLPTYQDVRGLFEKTTYDALRKAVDPATPGVAAAEIFFDNFGETPPGPDVPYALVSLTFDSTVQDVFGSSDCQGVEDLRGTLQCNVYTPKNKGSKPGEGICLNVMKDWLAIKNKLAQDNLALPAGQTPAVVQAAVRNLDGPRTIAPDARPHHVNVVSCAFIARTPKEVTTP